VERTVSWAAATALVTALAGAPLFAQGFDDATAAGLAKLGVQAPPVESISVEQQAEIQNVISSSDTDANKRRQIELILGEQATATGRLGVGQLQSSVGAGLAQLGVDASGVDQLTLSQLAQIENVMGGGDSDNVKKMRIEEIIGGEATATGRLGVAQLQDSAAAALAKLGVDADGVESLSLSQLGQIENVAASGVSDQDKKAQIETIIGQ
jgi:hypothetical protein